MPECVFCEVIAAGEELVLDNEHVAAFLDRSPVFHGHVLIVPVQHVDTLADLPRETMAPLLQAAQTVMRALEEVVGAQGSFVAVNNTVSQSVPHLHLHVVPRKRGDGLRGFFWPRHRYRDEAQRVDMRDRLRREIAALTS